MRILAPLGLLLAASALGWAQTELRVRGRVGDRYSYRLESKIEALGAQGSLRWTTLFTERLAKVAGGEFHWVTQFRVPRATADGVMRGADAGVKQMDGLTITFISNERGELLRSVLEGVESKAKPSANVTLPGRKARLNEQWGAWIQVGPHQIPVTYRFAALQKLGASKVALIEGTFPKDSPARSATPLRFWVDVANGKMVRAASQVLMTVQGKSMKVTYAIEREG